MTTGTGTVGTTLAASGHQIAVANSRGQEGLTASLAAASPSRTPITTAEAMACDAVSLAVPWIRVRKVPGRGPPRGLELLTPVNGAA